MYLVPYHRIKFEMHNNKMIQEIWTSSNHAMHAGKEIMTTSDKSACVCAIIILHLMLIFFSHKL